MKKADVQTGKIYWAKVSGKRVRVRLDQEMPRGGWMALNLNTYRQVRIKTAARLHGEAS